jgi:fibronectin-binding autotransporter adhesin
MKNDRSIILKPILTGLCLGLCVLAYQGRAQTNQYWDDNGAGTQTSSGNWDNTTANWANTATLTASTGTFTNDNFPIFIGGSAGIHALTITVPSPGVTCEGFGDGTTPAGATGAYATNLTFTGAGPITLATGTWSIDCGNGPAPTIIVNTPIVGPGGFVQHNSGSLALYGTNTYSGGTEITGGQIIFYNSSNSFGVGPITNTSASSIEISNGLSGVITLTNPFVEASGSSTLNFASGNTISSGPWTLFATAEIKNNASGSDPVTLSGPISGAFGIDLQAGNSTLATITLSGQNTYTGPTGIGYLITGATTVVSVTNINSVSTPAQQASSCLGKPSSVANGTISMGYGANAGQLTYTGPGETSDRLFYLSGQTGGAVIEMDGAGPLVLTGAFTAPTNGAKTLTLQGSSTTTNTIGGAIANSSSATTLSKSQAGTWLLGGLNTFTGGINITNGTLIIGLAGDLGNSGGNGSYAGAIINSGTFVYASSANQTLSGVISGAGSLQQNGGGTLTLSGADTYTGATTVGSSSTLILSGTGKLAANTPITDNGTFNITSTAGQTMNVAAGSGAFNQNAVGATTTLTNQNSTFSGLFTLNNGTLSMNSPDDSDDCLGTPPASPLANDITLNNAPAASLRANDTTSINANRGITLGASGGCIQVAGGAGTCAYNGIISGSGVFQDGVNSSTGAGILALGGSESYTNWTIISCGTLRLLAGGDIGNSAGILMSNTPTLDVSAYSPFNLSTTNELTVIATSNTPTAPPIILGPSGSSVNLGSQTVNLSYTPLSTNGDGSHEVLTVLQSSLVLNGNTINVTNAAGSILDAGYYALIQCTNGFTITTPPILNYVGSQTPNTTASLVIVDGNTLALQIQPTASYAFSTITNQSPYPSLTVGYGTATATFSGTVIAAGPTYPNLGESVNIEIPNVVTNATTISDSTGDFSLTMAITNVPAGTYAIIYSYPGTNSTLSPATDSSTTLTITKEALAIGATNQTKIYGQTLVTNASTAFTNSALQNGETIGSVTLTISGSPNGSISNAPIGTYTITPSAATGGSFNPGNYTITYVTGTLTIIPLPVGETGTRLYDGTVTATNKILSITNVLGGDSVTNVNGGYVTLAASSAGIESIVSPGTLTLGGARATNYTTVGITGAVTINPLPIGLAGTTTYNGTTTAAYNNLSITNVVGSDDVSLASGSATFAASSAGVQHITSASGLVLGGTTAGNYTTVGAIGSVTVNPLPIGLTGTRIYDGTATAVFSILSITNIVGSDVVNLTAGSAALAAPAVGVEPITSASGLTLGGAQAGDYTTTGAVGAVTVTSNPNPTTIGFSVNNNALTLSWPLDHTGWTLQAQTNSVSAGIGTNWVPVSGSTTTNQITVTIDPANGCVFYELLYTP